jgi:hypothetical protein
MIGIDEVMLLSASTVTLPDRVASTLHLTERAVGVEGAASIARDLAGTCQGDG